MKPVLTSFCLLAAFGSAYAAEDDDECIFDQDEQKEAYLLLEEQYAGSHYVEDRYALIIPGDGHQITLRRGGCVHFGVSIEYQTSRTEDYDDDDVFFAKVMALADEYGQGLIDVETLAQSIRDKNWHDASQGENAYYFLSYPDVAAFEIYRRHDHENTIIGVSSYY